METRLFTIHHYGGDEVEAVCDRFSVFALILPLIWAVWYRCWVTLVLIFGVAFLAASWNPLAASPAMYGVGLILAFEGASFRRWELGLRGWRYTGLVEAASPEGAEEQFLTGQAV